MVYNAIVVQHIAKYLEYSLVLLSDHLEQNEFSERVQNKMSKLQKNGRTRKRNEKTRGKIGKVGYINLNTRLYLSFNLLCSWSMEKASRKAAIKQLHKKLQRGDIEKI